MAIAMSSAEMESHDTNPELITTEDGIKIIQSVTTAMSDTTPAPAPYNTNAPTNPAASQIVFSTYELLAHILTLLPSAAVHRLRRVLTVWRDVSRSYAACLARSLKPVELLDPYGGIENTDSGFQVDLHQISIMKDDIDAFAPRHRSTSPYYFHTIRETHPALGEASVYQDTLPSCVRLTFDITSITTASKDAEQYISEPPISVVYIKAQYPKLEDETIDEFNQKAAVCTAHVRTGITLVYLAEITDYLKRSDPGFAVFRVRVSVKGGGKHGWCG